MECEWPEVKLDDVAAIKHGFAFKGEYFSDEPQTFVLLTPGNFSIGGGFQSGKPKYYAGPVPNDYVLVPGDLVVTMTDLSKATDTLGFAARVPKTPNTIYLHNQRTGLVTVRDMTAVRPEWLHYLMRSQPYRSWVVGSASGTTVKHTSPSRIGAYTFGLPPVGEQLQVAATLDAIEFRIDLLRQTNTTLEAIAQALFKSWFVDFDPVRAKAEGREPEVMDAATAALFPSEFEESELGLIPKGWARSSLGDVCAAKGGCIQTGPFGSQLHASDYVRVGVPVVMPQDLAGRRVAEDKVARVPSSDADRLARNKLKSGDIVFSRRGDVGRHAVVSEREVGWLCGTGCLLVRPGELDSMSTFVSAALARPESLEWLVRNAVGATMPNLNTKILSRLPIISPPDELVRAFERIASPLEHRMSANHAQMKSLADLRDTLLPRLISGKLRLPEAMESTQEALT